MEAKKKSQRVKEELAKQETLVKADKEKKDKVRNKELIESLSVL